MLEKSEFMEKYGDVVSRTWDDDTYLKHLLKDPAQALAEAGLKTPTSARINVITRELDPSANPNDQLMLWEKGGETGIYDVIIPIKPDDLDELPLPDDMLEAVAGGLASASLDACCCCPCCCC